MRLGMMDVKEFFTRRGMWLIPILVQPTMVLINDRYPDPQFTYQDLRTEIMSSFYNSMTELLRDHNAALPICQLPAEVLASAFAWVPTRDRAALGLVCKFWHEVLYAHPKIWAEVVFHGGYGTPDALTRILSFSAESPVHLDVMIEPHSYLDTCAAIMAYIHRFVILSVVIQNDLPTVARDSVRRALSIAAPRLRVLKIFDQAQFINLSDRYYSFLNNNAPELELVKIQCNLTGRNEPTVAFSSVRRVMFSPTRELTLTPLESLFKIFPRIEELSVEYDEWAGLPELEQPLSVPPTLRALVVVPNSVHADAERFLRTLQSSQVTEICVSHNLEAIDHTDGSILLALAQTPSPPSANESHSRPFVARSMSFEASTFSEDSLHIYMFETEQDAFQLVPYGARLPASARRRPGVERSVLDIGRSGIFDPVCFAHVRRLQLTEMAFDPDVVGQPIPPLPVLAHLTVYLLRRKAHAGNRNMSGLVSASLSTVPFDEEGRYLICPLLETFRIGSLEQDSLLDEVALLEPRIVSTFVKRHLRYNAKRLTTLYFNGVELLVNSAPEFQEMLNLAAETEWDERNLSWAFAYSELLDWR